MKTKNQVIDEGGDDTVGPGLLSAAGHDAEMHGSARRDCIVSVCSNVACVCIFVRTWNMIDSVQGSLLLELHWLL
jgi:hypothetical protein